MRALCIAAALAATTAAGGCGGPAATGPAAGTPEGDAGLIAAAQEISNALGGCMGAEGSRGESRVVPLERGAVVILACSEDAYSFSSRLFSVRGAGGPVLLSLPDFDASGWFASDQVSMPELDAGTGVLTTYRKSAGHGGCGSEGRYAWDGRRFILQELRWQGCDAPSASGPPFPIVWPAQTSPAILPDETTPAP